MILSLHAHFPLDRRIKVQCPPCAFPVGWGESADRRPKQRGAGGDWRAVQPIIDSVPSLLFRQGVWKGVISYDPVRDVNQASPCRGRGRGQGGSSAARTTSFYDVINNPTRHKGVNGADRYECFFGTAVIVLDMMTHEDSVKLTP